VPPGSNADFGAHGANAVSENTSSSVEALGACDPNKVFEADSVAARALFRGLFCVPRTPQGPNFIFFGVPRCAKECCDRRKLLFLSDVLCRVGVVHHRRYTHFPGGFHTVSHHDFAYPHAAPIRTQSGAAATHKFTTLTGVATKEVIVSDSTDLPHGFEIQGRSVAPEPPREGVGAVPDSPNQKLARHKIFIAAPVRFSSHAPILKMPP
jgi:hypothetical protein